MKQEIKFYFRQLYWNNSFLDEWLTTAEIWIGVPAET